MRTRPLAFLLLWMSRFEQLAWGPLLLPLFLAAGDREETFMAVAASAFSLANLGGNLLAGPALDRWGRYFLSGIGLLLMSVTAGLHLAVAVPVALVSMRVLHGLTSAIISPASLAAVGDDAPQDRRAETMARAGIVIALATMLGPALLGGVARAASAQTAILVLAGLLGVSGLVTLAKGRAADHEIRQTHADAPAEKAAGPALNFGRVALAAAIAFALFFAQNVFFYKMPLDAHAMGLAPSHTGLLFAVFALASVFAFAPPLSRIGDRFGRRPALLIGLALAAGSLALVSFARTPVGLAGGLFAYGLGFGFIFPAVAALSTDAAVMRRRGTSFGLFTAAASAGAVVGPLVTNALRQVLSPYMVASLMLAAGLVVVVVWDEQREGRQEAVSS